MLRTIAIILVLGFYASLASCFIWPGEVGAPAARAGADAVQALRAKLEGQR